MEPVAWDRRQTRGTTPTSTVAFPRPGPNDSPVLTPARSSRPRPRPRPPRRPGPPPQLRRPRRVKRSGHSGVPNGDRSSARGWAVALLEEAADGPVEGVSVRSMLRRSFRSRSVRRARSPSSVPGPGSRARGGSVGGPLLWWSADEPWSMCAETGPLQATRRARRAGAGRGGPGGPDACTGCARTCLPRRCRLVRRAGSSLPKAS